VLCTGLAAGRAVVSLERVAINVCDARIADNAGLQPVDVPVLAGAPAAYFASLPLKAMLAALRGRGIPCEVSNSAGTFVCNALAFQLAHGIATRWLGLRGGFIHLPATPAQAATHPGWPSMALETMVEALRTALAAAIAHPVDLALGAGAEH
jgi:pyroglutamyl-peptidase